MTTHDLNAIDQSDAVTLKSRLSLHAANLRGMVHASSGQLIAPPSLTGDVLADIRALEVHSGELESQLAGTAPAFKPPAAPTALVKATPPEGRKPTLDEEAAALLVKHCCKNAVELQAKLQADKLAVVSATK